jgi:hypothetical protein
MRLDLHKQARIHPAVPMHIALKTSACSSPPASASPLTRSHHARLPVCACLVRSIFSPGFNETAKGMDELVDMMCVCQLTVFSDIITPKLGKDVRSVPSVSSVHLLSSVDLHTR